MVLNSQDVVHQKPRRKEEKGMRPIIRKALILSAVVVLIQAAIFAGLYFSGCVTDITRLLVISIFVAPIVLIERDLFRMPVSPGMSFMLFSCAALGYFAWLSGQGERHDLSVFAALAVGSMAVVTLCSGIDFAFEDQERARAVLFFAILATPQALIAAVMAGYLLRF
ncbi:MAG: hypothetical protein ACYC48_01820 [Minisyncoccota bacterium]